MAANGQSSLLNYLRESYGYEKGESVDIHIIIQCYLASIVEELLSETTVSGSEPPAFGNGGSLVTTSVIRLVPSGSNFRCF
jgi:hypothetical protein